MNLSFALPLSAVLAVAALAPLARADEHAAVSYKFRTPPVNSMGITSLDELRGKPVLVDFWGTR
jgi:hypothetical protein